MNHHTVNRIVSALLLCVLACPPARARAADAPEIRLGGLLDLVVAGQGEGRDLNVLNRGDSNFDPYRLRLFADAEATPGVHVFAQALVEEAVGVRPIGVYATVTPLRTRDLHLMAGKMPWIIGTFGPRTYSDKNPLIGTPLAFQLHTSLRPDRVPPSADALLAAAGSGHQGPVYDGAGRGFKGMPTAYDICWDTGIALTGSERFVEYAIGVTSGAPSAADTRDEARNGGSVLGRLGVIPWPGVRLGLSASHGPYLLRFAESQLPQGTVSRDWAQSLWMADAEWMFGHVELRAEAFRNTWESPYAGDLDSEGGHLEARLALPSGAFAAARVERMAFGNVTDSLGAARPWDHPVDRIELGLGLRITRGAVVKAVYQRQGVDRPAARQTYDLVATQLSLRF